MATNPPQPLWLGAVRGVQLLLALVTLGLSAYAISVVGSFSAYNLNIFTSIITLFYAGYIVVSTFVVPTLFNIWISLIFQAFLAIFWLSTFGTLAALAVAYGAVGRYYNDYYDDDYSYRYGGYNYTDEGKVVVATTKASAALTALIWVSFVATLIYTTLSALRHGRGNTTTAPAVAQEHKLEPVAGQPTPTSYQPVQQQYAQQPQYAAPYAAPGAEYPPQQQFQQQPTGYPQQQFQQPTGYPQQTTSPAPYQQAPVQYPQQTGSPSPGAVQQPPYPQQGAPAQYPPQ